MQQLPQVTIEHEETPVKNLNVACLSNNELKMADDASWQKVNLLASLSLSCSPSLHEDLRLAHQLRVALPQQLHQPCMRGEIFNHQDTPEYSRLSSTSLVCFGVEGAMMT